MEALVTPGEETETSLLSQFIHTSLSARAEEWPLFYFLFTAQERQQFDSPGNEDALYKYRVAKRTWLCLVHTIHEMLSAVMKEQQADATLCHVGLFCQETFYACLVESACFYLGKSFCVLNPADPERRRAELLGRVRPCLVLTDEAIESVLQEAQKSEAHRDVSPAVVPDSAVAYYMHTSGSSGLPKCVVVSRANMHAYVTGFCQNADGLAMDHATSARDRVLCVSTPFFDPSIGDMAATLLSPTTALLVVPRVSLLAGELGALLSAVRPTHVVTTPVVWSTVTTQALPHGGPPLKVFVGGERMSQQFVDTWCGAVDLHNVYGLTEATVYQGCVRVPPGGVCVSDLSCGAGTGSSVFYLDRCRLSAEEKNTVGETVGELVVCGPQVCCGYLGERPAASSSPFGVCPRTGARLLYTGDLAEPCGDGPDPPLRLRGRRDWQVKVNGQRVALEEVEETMRRALQTSFSAYCTCVVPSPTGEGQQTLFGAAVVLARGCVESADLAPDDGALTWAVQHLLSLFLPTAMIPSVWLFLPSADTLPQSATGKVDRRQLAHLLSSRSETEGSRKSHDASSMGRSEKEDPLFRLVREVWVRYFGVAVNADTHFAQVGGDSLGALRLTRQVFLALGGTDDDIDAHGILPPPFRPHVLLAHPCLGAYVAALRAELCAVGNEQFRLTEGEEDISPPATASGPAPEGSECFLRVVALGCVDLAGLLLAHHLADVDGGNTRQHRCTTPLHAAANLPVEETALAMLRLLLMHGAKPTCVNLDGVTPHHLAATHSVGRLQLLLQEGGGRSALHCRDSRQQSLLHFAARAGNTEVVLYLLTAHQADLAVRDKWQRSPAHWALLNGHKGTLCAMAAHVTAARSKKAEVDSSEAKATKQEEGGGSGRGQLRRGHGSARYTRLAGRKTHLAYESLPAMAARVAPEDAELRAWCETLAEVVEQ